MPESAPDFQLTVRTDGSVWTLEPLTACARQWCEETCGVDTSEPEFRLNIFRHAIERYLSAINAAGLRVIEIDSNMSVN